MTMKMETCWTVFCPGATTRSEPFDYNETLYEKKKKKTLAVCWEKAGHVSIQKHWVFQIEQIKCWNDC